MHDFFEIEVYDYPGIRLTSVHITKTIVARNAKGRFMSVYASARAVKMSGNEEKRLTTFGTLLPIMPKWAEPMSFSAMASLQSGEGRPS